MSFVKDSVALKTAQLLACYGQRYAHIADLYLRKAYGRSL